MISPLRHSAFEVLCFIRIPNSLFLPKTLIRFIFTLWSSRMGCCCRRKNDSNEDDSEDDENDEECADLKQVAGNEICLG